VRINNPHPWGKGLNELLLFFFIVSSFYVAAKAVLFVLMVVSDKTDPEPIVMVDIPISPEMMPKPSGINIHMMQSWDLFGSEIKENDTKKIAQTENAPDTTLQIRLEGVFRSEIESLSAAIISDGSKPGVLYRVGQSLPQGAELIAVEARRVLLKYNGEIQALRFPKSQGDQSIVLSRVQQPVKKPFQLPGKRGKVGTESAPAGSSEFSGDPATVIAQLQSQLKEDSGAMLGRFGLQSLGKEEGGGYRVTAQTPKEFVQMLGLKKGDIVRAINGQVLGDVAADQLLLDQVLAEKSVRVEIQRGSRQFTINFDLPK
jgi:general secretion pathway protein C